VSSRRKVAVVIPTLNVEKIIKPTLDSVSWCDEIIIVDMFSTDGTKALCTSYPNCRFIERKDYIYGNVNHGIDQAESEWIIRLDSDEVLSPELRSSIETVLCASADQFDGYECRSDLFFMGYQLRYGFGKDNYREILFKKGFGRYRVQSEHEGVERRGRWGRLAGAYLHYTNPTISTWINKLNYYSDRDIERLTAPKAPPVIRMFYRPLRWFGRYYVYPQQAFRDGMPGLVVACIAAGAMFLQEFKTWEKAERMARGPDYRPPHPNA
jgi:glycosyltransferase involved in cell wall biosynthesis